MRIGTSMLVIVVSLALVTAGCGKKSAPQPLPETPPPPAQPPPQTEPTAATAEELESVPPPPSVPQDAEGWATPPEPESSGKTTFGYRVQIFASATRDGAEAAADQARSRFSEPVNIEYEPPFYKVRVGNCVTRHEAERLKDLATELGYDGPFIAETMVDVR